MKSSELNNLYSKPLPSSRSGLFYNTFSYPTKISPEAIAIYIAMHTKPGDTVLDMFGGSGSTGLAAQMCEYPTEKMLKMTEDFGINPVWGARNAEIYEVGRYGSFASNILCNPPSGAEFSNVANEFFNRAHEKLDWVYRCIDDFGEESLIRHTVWSDMLVCPSCGTENTYHDMFIKHSPIKIEDKAKCSSCGFCGSKGDFDNKLESVYDPILNKSNLQKVRIPVIIYGQTGKRKWKRRINQDDKDLIQLVKKEYNNKNVEPLKIEWGELYRAGYHTGVTHLHHFYTSRNFYIMSELWEMTNEYSDIIRDSLRLVLLSYNAAHSTLMTRVVVKKNSKDFVLTSAQSGVLYISSLPVEKNIILGAKRKLKNFIEAFKYINKCSGKVNILNKSSEELKLNKNSIDYLFTDPPFGDFIPYAEVNQLNELWLGHKTNKTNEVIISGSQNKNLDVYESMMTKIFLEANRVLKDDAKATVVFHSSKAKVWEAMKNVINTSNFNIEKTSILNKTQATFKQTVSKGSVQGDPVLLIEKGKGNLSTGSSKKILELITEQAKGEKVINVRQLYSQYISKCLEEGISIEIDAKEAYEFINRKIGV